MLFLFCVVLIRTPITPKNAPQSVPRLYTGNGQVKNTEHFLPLLWLLAPLLLHFLLAHLLSWFLTHDTFGLLGLSLGRKKTTQDVERSEVFCTNVSTVKITADLIVVFPPRIPFNSVSSLFWLNISLDKKDYFHHPSLKLLHKNGRYFYLGLIVSPLNLNHSCLCPFKLTHDRRSSPWRRYPRQWWKVGTS